MELDAVARYYGSARTSARRRVWRSQTADSSRAGSGAGGVFVGWTEEEVNILHKALMKFGVGNWSQIIESGCLPGKTNAQLNNQTQRMLGQQSTAGTRRARPARGRRRAGR